MREPLVLNDEPIIRGTRLAVRHIVLASREFDGPDGVLEAYPHLTSADVQAALSFYEAHRAEIDRYIAENLADD